MGGLMRTWIIAAAAALAMGVGLAAPASQADEGSGDSPTAVTTQPPGILFVTGASKANLRSIDGSIRLSMPARTMLTWFTDRPDRRSGRTDLARLVKTWEASGFDTDPPNAALLLTDRAGRQLIHVVTATNARRAGSWVHLDVTALPGEQAGGYAHTHALRTGSFTRASLFIDDAAYPPCPSLVSSPIDCIITNNDVTFQWMEANSVGEISACGSGPDPAVWLLQAKMTIVDGDRIDNRGPVFANGRLLEACSLGVDQPIPSAIQVLPVFPSTAGGPETQVTIINWSYPPGTPTIGDTGVPEDPPGSPVLLSYRSDPTAG